MPIATTSVGVSAFINRCRIDVSAPTLNLATPRYRLTTSDLTIHSQSGTDFSIADFPPTAGGALISAKGGYFQASFFLGPPGGVTLDAGSTDPRYMEFALVTGDPSSTFHSFGMDAFVPVSAASLGDLAVTPVSTPGLALPGGKAVWGVTLEFVAVFGTDAITGPFDNSAFIDVWQVG